MKTINEIKSEILSSNPSKIYTINDEEFEQTEEEFQDAVEKRAKMEYEQQLLTAETEAKRIAAEAKLEALGLTSDDLKALGL
jgi:vacuolar-type H+-ATPase subunit E/Vma4